MARRSSSRAIPFPIAGPRRGARRDPGRGHRAHPARPGQPRHQPDGADPARRRAGRRARPPRDRHAGRRRARARDGAGRPRRPGRRLLDRQRPQVAVRPEGDGRAVGPGRSPRPDPPARRVARCERRAPRTDPLPPRVRLGRHDATRPATWHSPRRSTGWARSRRPMAAAGRRSWPPTMRSRSRLATCLPRRSGSTHRRPTRCSARWRPCRWPGVRDAAAAEALGRQLELEDGIQVPIGAWPAPAAQADDGERRILIRISAQRYNEPADYERLAEALVRRVGAQAGATR